jgi:squalene-hopene/tetraprenyl-beta-curcumene cyclase
MNRFRSLRWTFLVTGLAALPATAADTNPTGPEIKAVVDKAAEYLRKTQSPDGSWSAKTHGPGVTGIVVAGLLRHGYSTDDPMVAKAMAYLEKSVKNDGGIYDDRLANYTTSVAMMAFHEANKGGKYERIIQNASKFLKGLQTGGDPKDVASGGVGYDGKSRPDLSNTQFFVDALLASGVPKDDPAVQNALRFITRCQNLPGEGQDQAFARKAVGKDDEGGFTYTPIDPDDSKHKTPDGGLRSLGGMTYGGLKSFLYAGVDKKDPRVQGAIKWIRLHYTLDENPGMGKSGLYYYYHTFAKAMVALGEDPFEDAKKVKHVWRRELLDALKKRQKADGSFVNEGDRAFGEADPNLATGFAILTLSYAKPAK